MSDVAGSRPAPRRRRTRLLVVDDDELARAFASEVLRQAGHEVLEAPSGERALEIVATECPDAVISDLVMPGIDGMTLLRWMHEHASDTPVVLMTGNSDVEAAVQAMRAGASDYLTKPFPADALTVRVTRALERAALIRETRDLRASLAASTTTRALIGGSSTIARLREQIQVVAQSDVSVLVMGETGTGKELVVRALHGASPRRDQPFVAVNCAALPETLIASELFGHERGSFTNAVQARVGRFEAADGGTLFLDEIGDLPLATQGTLLRVLQEKQFERVGSSRSRDVDVRVLAATRQDLQKAVHDGRFREDLFFRINVIQVLCPPLRERRGDIPLLVEHFLQGRAASGPPPEVTQKAVAKLMAHDWPGNVRELENVVTRAMVFARGPRLDAEDLDLAQPECRPEADVTTLALDHFEKAHVGRVLRLCNWNQSDAAKALGIDRGTLHRRIVHYGLAPDDRPAD